VGEGDRGMLSPSREMVLGPDAPGSRPTATDLQQYIDALVARYHIHHNHPFFADDENTHPRPGTLA
jgi:hypothetical protein